MIHPIEVESYEILRKRVDLASFGPVAGAVVARIIHASADLEFATTTVVDDANAAAAVTAIADGAPLITDVQMVRAGITTHPTECYLADAVADGELTRSAAAMRLAAQAHPTGAVFVIGCAPTALFELIRLAEGGDVDPAFVIGLPVGFVGAAESKAALRDSGLAAVSNIGEKGGSAVASAAANALIRLSREQT